MKKAVAAASLQPVSRCYPDTVISPGPINSRQLDCPFLASDSPTEEVADNPLSGRPIAQTGKNSVEHQRVKHPPTRHRGAIQELTVTRELFKLIRVKRPPAPLVRFRIVDKANRTNSRIRSTSRFCAGFRMRWSVVTTYRNINVRSSACDNRHSYPLHDSAPSPRRYTALSRSP